jgi:hypothetical protein
LDEAGMVGLWRLVTSGALQAAPTYDRP